MRRALAVAVRPAGVIDEPRDVAADVRVTHPAPVHGEAPDLAALQIARFALEALLVIDELPFVPDDASVLVDGLQRKDTPPVHPGASSNDPRQLFVTNHGAHRIARVCPFCVVASSFPRIIEVT